MLLMAEIASATDVTSVLTVLGAVVTFFIGQISALVTLVMSEPLLLIPIGITITFLVVKFFKYIFSLVR